MRFPFVSGLLGRIRSDDLLEQEMVAVLGRGRVESGAGACDLEGVCPSQPNWRRINDALRQALSDVTLLDISTPSPLPLSRKNIKGDIGQVSNH